LTEKLSYITLAQDKYNTSYVTGHTSKGK